MDQLTAHLDRGWDLVRKGDLRGARASARRALESDRESPEVHNLLGFIAAQEGEPETALEHYRQAMALDDGYIDPILNAAEIHAHVLHQWDEAIRLCDDVLDFAEGKEELIDAIVLKCDALLGKGDREGARASLNGLPTEPLEAPLHNFLVGRAWFEVGEAQKAEPYLQAALKEESDDPEAHYYSALVHEALGRRVEAANELLLTRELDLRSERPPWSMSAEKFLGCVRRALDRLEAPLRARIRDIAVYVSDVPGPEVVVEGVDPRAPMLLDGPAPKSPNDPVATRLFVYQRNIERFCDSEEAVEEEVHLQATDDIRHAIEAEGQEPSQTTATLDVLSALEMDAKAKAKRSRKN